MYCQPAGLAALSHLTNLETLGITALGYREQSADGKWVFARKEERIVERLWQMIRARKAGTPLSDEWLVKDGPTEAESRAMRAAILEKHATDLKKQIEAMKKQIDRLLEEAKRLRAGD